MTLLRRLLGERRAITAADFDKGLFESRESYSGVDVNRDSALNYIPVWACVRLVSESVAQLPVKAYKKKDREVTEVPSQPGWITGALGSGKPNPEADRFEFWERHLTSLNLDGNAYTLVGALDKNFYPSELWNLHPSDIRVERDGNNRKIFRWKGTEVLKPWNPVQPAAGSVLHIKAFSNGGDKGLNPIDAARQGIGIGMAAEEYGARFYGEGQVPSGVIQVDKEVTVDEDFRRAIRDKWMRAHGGVKKSHIPAVLKGATWNPITVPNDTAQFLETRKFQKADIATFFRVPPHMIGDVERTTSWGAGIEQQSIGFVVYSILPWLARLESAYMSMIPRGQYLKWNVNGLLRGDAKSRNEAYKIAVECGWLTRNEVRELEELNPLDGLDEPLTPMQMILPKTEITPGGSDGA